MAPIATSLWQTIMYGKRLCGGVAYPSFTTVMQRLDQIQHMFGVPPWLLLSIGAIMFGSWTACYAAIIVRCFKEKAYGVPILTGCLCISWEAIYTFNFAGMVSIPLNLGNAFWLIPDSLVLLQIFLYGKKMQTDPWIRKHFYTIVTATLAASAFGLYEFIRYYNDIFGVSSSWVIDVMISGMFIGLFFRRPDLKGIPYSATWFKLFGNVGGALFCYFWWPAQFQDGKLTACWANREVVTIHAPTSFVFVNFLYLLVPVLDIILIYLVWKRRKELRNATPAPTDAR